MTLLTTLTFNTETEGEAFPASLSSPWSHNTQAGETPATYTTAAALHSTRGVAWSDVSHYQNAQYDNATGIASMCNSFYFRLTTMPGAILYIGEIYDTTNARIAYLRINAAAAGVSTMAVTNVNTATATTTGTVAVNTWYRVEHLVSGTTQELKVFLGDSATPIAGMDVTGVANGNSCRYAGFGVMAASAAGGAIEIDYVRVADSFTGPFGNSAGGSISLSGTAASAGRPAGTGSITLGGTATPAGFLLLSTETFEEGTDGTNIEGFSLTGTGWITGTGGSFVQAGATPATFAAAAAAHGSLGMQYSDVSHFQVIEYDDGAGLAVLCLSGYFRVTTMPGAILYLATVQDTTSTDIAKLRINVPASGQSTMTITGQSTQVAITTGKIVANTWYRFEWKLIAATSTQEVKIFLGEGSSPIAGMDISGAYTGTNQPRFAHVGVPTASASGGAVQFDTLRVSNDFPGPFVTAYTWVLRTAAGDIPLFMRLKTS